MAEKNMKARIVHKHDTEANWLKATNFIPMKGEIIIYDKDTNYSYERIKIGDGTTLVSALPFVDDALKTTLLEQINTVDDKVDAISTLVGDTSVSSQISSAIANKSDSGHTHDDRYYTESEINTKLSAKADADHTHEISELTDLSGATVSHATTADSADEAAHATTADTANAVAWANVTGKPSTYTPATHSHAISDVTNLQTTLNAKVPTSRTINSKALSANITLSASDVGADASGSADTALTNAKAYTDDQIGVMVGDETVSDQITTVTNTLNAAIDKKADTSVLTSHTGNTTVHITSTERTNWNSAKTHADSAHAPSNAEKNQNAFSNVTVGSTTIAADTTTDTLTLVAGSNITLTPDATNDKITITAKDTTYSAAGSALGLVKSGGDVTISSGVITVNDDSHNHTIANVDGLQSALDGKETSGAAASALSNAKSYTDAEIAEWVGDATVSSQISTAVTNVKNDLLNGAGAAYDTLKELGDLIDTNTDAIDALETVAAGKADANHTHNYAGSSSAGGAATSANKVANTLTIKGNGTTSFTYDGSAAKTLNIKPGNNVSVSSDTSGNITIAATDTVYSHPNSGVTAGTYKSVTVNAQGHVTSGSNPTTLSGYGITDAATKTELNAVSTLVGDTAVSDQINTAVADKADTSAGQYAVTATSSDGVAYTATVPGITTLTSGVSFIMIPGKVSASTTPTLNVNGLGEKNIRRRLSHMATAVQTGYTATWLSVNRPFRVTYDGNQWIVEGHERPAGADLYGAAAKATADADGNVITETYATIAALQALLPKVTSMTLTTSWLGDAAPYYQDVELSCCTETSMVDIQPTPEQLVSWHNDGFAFTTLSGAGTVRVYASGSMPNEEITVQVKVQEVVVI